MTYIVNILKSLSDVGQLRNLWMRSSSERLACWREFRLELQEIYDPADGNSVLEAVNAVNTWWTHSPSVNIAIDPTSPANWPDIWEIICQGECCKYSRSLAMAYNLHYMDQEADVVLHLVYDTEYNDECMVAIFNGRYVLNSLRNSIVDMQTVNTPLQIKESWNIRDLLYNKN